MKEAKKSKLMYRIMTLFSLTFLIILSFLLIVFYIFLQLSLKNTSIDFSKKIIAQVDTSINNYIANINCMYDVILENEEANAFWDKKLVDRGALEDNLQTLSKTQQDILNVFLINLNNNDKISNRKGEVFNENINIEKTLWYKGLFEEKKEVELTSSYVQNMLEGDYSWVISMAKKVKLDKDGGDDKENYGVILIDIKYTTITELCNRAIDSKNGYLYIIDDSNNLVYHPKQQMIYSGLYDENVAILNNDKIVTNNNNIYAVINSEKSDWRTVGVIQIDTLIQGKDVIFLVYMLITIFFIIVILIISYFLSKKITKPLTELETMVGKVKGGDFKARANVKSNDEIEILSDAFNNMTEKIDELVLKSQREQEEKREMMIQALKAQINPHFLYNTLDSIIWLAEEKNQEGVVEMTSSLGKMLRASISNEKKEISLEIEIQNVLNYLKIQKYRYKNKLNYVIDIPKELYDNRVEHLSLQPLVENAIYHGVKEKKEGGTIIISAKVEADKLIVEVSDNGKGMSENRLVEVLSMDKSKRGIGLYNVDKRIKLTFGEQFGLNITSEENIGTKITMIMPNIKVDKENE